MDEMAALKKHVKLLSIGLITMSIVTLLTFLLAIPSRFKPETWPDLTVGKLTAKELRIVSPDGQNRIVLEAGDGDGTAILADREGKARLVFSADSTTGGYVTIRGAEKTNQLILTNATILMGDIAKPSFRVDAPTSGGPRILLQDEDGYSASIGRTLVTNKVDGTRTFTSTASIVGSSRDLTSQWILVRAANTPK